MRSGTGGPRSIRRLVTDHGELVALAAVVLVVPLVLPRRPTAGVVGLGAVAGAALALQAVGLVLVYRSNRFVNFAQVAFGAVAATTFTVMVHARPAVRAVQSVCPPCLERVTPAVRNANYALAFVVALGVAAGLSWASSRLVFRRFAAAPRLVLTVASIFLLQLLAALDNAVPRFLSTRAQRESAVAVRAPAPLPFDVRLRVGKVVLHAGDLLLLAAAAAAVVGITVWLRGSGRGTAIRAASERPERAETLGVDVGRLDGQVWLLAGLLSGVAGVLTATSVGSGSGSAGVTPVALLVRILAVAVIARMTSLPVAGLAALAIGVLDQAAFFAFDTSQVMDGALLFAVGGALLLQSDRRSRSDDDSAGTWRATREVRPIPAVLAALPVVKAWRRRAVGVVAVVVLGLPWVLSSSQTSVASIVLLEAVAGLSLLVLTGWAGQVSLGQFAFAAVGAWVAAACRLPFPLAVLVGSVAGAVVAVVVGVPALRLRGLHLAITTLALALAASALLLNPRYGGRALPARLARPSLVGLDLGDPRSYYYLCLAALGLVVASVTSMRRSRTARALIAARDNPAAAQSFGIDLVTARLGAFAVSGFLAALAGSLVAFQQGGVQVLAFPPERSIRLFAFAVIGGLGSVGGPLLGFAYEGVLSLASASPLVVGLSTGAGGLVLLLLLPGGLSGLFASLRDTWLRRVARRHRIDVPGLLGRAGAVGGPVGGAAITPVRADGPTPPRYELDDQWALS
ncbi:MAG: branched-chain amino acid transport system permease protein livM [Acidimicrobiaceae bacterium]|nr:branched-chain amino acid transport system permease protein livM [Acidimicrobiaceae bacterium]